MSSFDKVEDELSWELGAEIVPKYLGDDMTLLLGLSDTKAEEMVNEEAQRGTTPFYSLEKWNPSSFRLVPSMSPSNEDISSEEPKLLRP